MAKNMFSVFFFLIILFNRLSAKVSFSENAYKDIVVYIHPKVQESETLIDNIKSSFTAASDLLHKATSKHFYFGEITILIPKTWSAKDSYENAEQESKDTMDVHIGNKNGTKVTDAPYTPQSKGCGQMGECIYLTDTFMVDDPEAEKYGPREKVLVHEWGHYRFGLYDEYPLSDKKQFYSSSNGNVEATRCSLAIKGQRYNVDTGGECNMDSNGFPEKACRFRPTSKSSASSFGSLMYRQNLNQITQFCTDDAAAESVHNSEAPNNQNKLCAGKSAWEVIRELDEFKNSDPITISDTTPKFRLVQKKTAPKIVMVLDISGSMNAENKLNKLRQGCYSFLRFVVSSCSEVGIVLFNQTAFTTRHLAPVTEDSRAALVEALPNMAKGATSIGAGLIKALEMMKGNTKGNHIIVVSDGEETNEPFISNVTLEVLEAKVTVHAIAITRKAAALLDGLSTETNGQKYLFVPDNAASFFAAFRKIGDSAEDSCYKETSNGIEAETAEIEFEKPAVKEFIIDATLGRDLLIIFEFQDNNFEIVITSPSGRSYNKRDEDEFWCQKEFKACQFHLPQAEPGVWKIVFSSNDFKQTISYTVECKSADKSVEAPKADIEWKNDGEQTVNSGTKETQKLFVKVGQGSSPVLNASVRVAISRPNAVEYNIDLRDNGAGADSYANDGVYSANFIAYSEPGRYSAEASVEGNEQTATNTDAVIGLDEGASGKKNSESLKSTGPFKRSAIGQSFQVLSYTPGPGGKIFPPDRIQDLVVSAYDANDERNFTVTLEWTAVGEQADVGRASEYELRYGTDGSEIRKSFTNLPLVSNEMVINDADLMNPQPAASREVFLIGLPRDREYYAFGVVAIDRNKRNSTSEISNVAVVSFKNYTEPVPVNIPVVQIENSMHITYIIITCGVVLFAILFGVCILALIKCRAMDEVASSVPDEDFIFANETQPHEPKRNQDVHVML